MAADDEDECSSYGSEYSGEWEMETSKQEAEKGLGEAMQAMKATLASLERMVLSVQFDMTCVRDDLKVVHNVVDNIADQLCELRDAPAEAETYRENIAGDVGAFGTWKANGNVEARAKSPDILSERDKDVILPDFDTSYDPPSYQPGSYIEDTPQFENFGRNEHKHHNDAGGGGTSERGKWTWSIGTLRISPMPPNAEIYGCGRAARRIAKSGNDMSKHSVPNTRGEPINVERFYRCSARLASTQ